MSNLRMSPDSLKAYQLYFLNDPEWINATEDEQNKMLSEEPMLFRAHTEVQLAVKEGKLSATSDDDESKEEWTLKDATDAISSLHGDSTAIEFNKNLLFAGAGQDSAIVEDRIKELKQQVNLIGAYETEMAEADLEMHVLSNQIKLLRTTTKHSEADINRAISWASESSIDDESGDYKISRMDEDETEIDPTTGMPRSDIYYLSGNPKSVSKPTWKQGQVGTKRYDEPYEKDELIDLVNKIRESRINRQDYDAVNQLRIEATKSLNQINASLNSTAEQQFKLHQQAAPDTFPYAPE